MLLASRHRDIGLPLLDGREEGVNERRRSAALEKEGESENLTLSASGVAPSHETYGNPETKR